MTRFLPKSQQKFLSLYLGAHLTKLFVKVTGVAPEAWRGGNCSCTVALLDGSNLSMDDFGLLLEYMMELQDLFAKPRGPQNFKLGPRGFQQHVQFATGTDRYNYNCEVTVDVENISLLAPRVLLVGLEVDSLNGCEGFRGRWLPSDGRYQVFLDTGREIALRPMNLLLLKHDRQGIGVCRQWRQSTEPQPCDCGGGC